MHAVEADIRKWSKDFLEVPSETLGGLPPCPYAKQAWLENKVKFSINTDIDELVKEIKEFDTHSYDIVVWASELLPDVQYLDGFCDGMNEALAIGNQDIHLMVFHPDYDANDAGLEFLINEDVTDSSLTYCMVFVQRLSLLDDASVSLAKTGYYRHFPEEVYNSLVLHRRSLRHGNG